MKIRSKISLYLGPFILIVISVIFLLNYSIIRRDLTENANVDLAQLEKNIHSATQTLLSSAIANYLRGITEKNIDFIEEQYAFYRMGKITEAEAKDRIQMHFDLQPVGESGYMVAVKESEGELYLDLHPYLPRQECTQTEGCRTWVRVRNGYLEYDWKNPTDNSFRKKAAYVMEFPAWNWVVGASSYRDEFVELVNIDDLRQLISPIRINKDGYFFVFDKNNRLLIHPEFSQLEGGELINSRGENILEMLRENEGDFVTYLWKNPSENKERMKYAIVGKLEEYDWYLVATGYLSEVYEPIEYLRSLTTILVLITGGVLFWIIVRLSNNLTFPLHKLEEGVTSFYRDQEPFSWHERKIDEIDVLGKALSRMSSELNRSMQDLQVKNQELAISEKEKDDGRVLLDGIINSMPSIIIGVDPNLMISQWNNQAEEATGFTFEKVEGKSLFEVYRDLEVLSEPIRKSIKSNIVKNIPHENQDLNGNMKYSEIAVYPLITKGNKGAVIRIDDVTGRVEMELRLRQSQKMDAVGQLAGGIAHDFNNMLSGIVGAAELLRLRVSDDDQKLVKIIREASGRAGELIQKLLAFSRKESVQFKPLDLHVIVRDTLEILGRTLDKKISITAQLEAKSSVINGDWSQLQNSLLNIGINAGHAMPDGGELSFITSTAILDELYCETSPFDLVPGNYLQVSIRDSGCGIEETNIRHIFEPFFTTRDQDKGTGLGLAAVYGAVQQHHGAIFVYSEKDRGTEFSLFFPLTESEEVTASSNVELVMGDGCILIIDDESMVRTTARLMLERLGYKVIEAENGKEGLEVYRQHTVKIDLVLLDMLMPVMDGTECFHQIRKVNPDAVVVVSSGFTRDADLSALKEEGLLNFVRKPYSMTELSEVVSQAIRGTV